MLTRKIALRYPSCPTPFVFKEQAPHFLTGVVLIIFLSLSLTRSLSFIGRCAGTVNSFAPLSLSTNIQPTYQGCVYLFYVHDDIPCDVSRQALRGLRAHLEFAQEIEYHFSFADSDWPRLFGSSISDRKTLLGCAG